MSYVRSSSVVIVLGCRVVGSEGAMVAGGFLVEAWLLIVEQRSRSSRGNWGDDASSKDW
jgi:hypothetical protein